MQLTDEAEGLTPQKLSDIHLLLPVQTVAIGCHHHICRQKVEGKDELFKYILKWLSKFYVEIRIPVEGGKIAPLKRLHVKLRKIIN